MPKKSSSVVNREPNVELLDRVLDTIKQTPERWDQSVWSDVYRSMEAETAVVNGVEVVYTPIKCDTSFCFAGWAIFLEQPNALWTHDQELWAEQADLDYWRDVIEPEQNAEGHDVWSDMVESPIPYNDGTHRVSPALRAARLLGLNNEQANSLFDGDNSFVGLEKRVAQIKAGEPVTPGGYYNDEEA